MMKFLFSLKTAVWTLFILICVFFVGSYMMPVHRGVFAPMNDVLLFDWVKSTALPNIATTWWFFLALALLVLLTINTVMCSVQAILGRWSRRNFLIRISPQIVHAGFLFILLAHLLGAGWGYRLTGALPEGGYGGLPENRGLSIIRINVEADAQGYLKDWSVDVTVYDNKDIATSGSLGPNRPLFYKGVGIYLKTLSFEQGPVAVLMVNKDPGAVWAFVGSLLFILGLVPLLAVKWKAGPAQSSLS